MPEHSSRQAAKKLGLPPQTLSTYITVGKIPAPKSVKAGGLTVYLWTDEDIEQARKLLPKIANGRKTRYQKKQSVVSTQQSAKPKTKKQPQAKRPVPHEQRKKKK